VGFQQEAPAPVEPGLLITKTSKGRLARGDASKALPNPFVKTHVKFQEFQNSR